MNFITKTLFFALLITIFNIVYMAKGQAGFTKVPPSMLYVSIGKTARFVWDYTVDDRTKDFQDISPKWSFYDPNNSESIISYELVFEQRKWTINNITCPKRLLNPTRVGREPNATLVIGNITIADSGTYGCSLMLTTKNPITSKVKLIVTTIPKITIETANTTTVRIKESESLDIRCSATGNPRPNLTWIGLTLGNIVSEGVGNATLTIKNITKRRGGGYECRASNNPNEKPVTMEVKIIVLFSTESPSINGENGNKPTTYRGTTRVTKQASTQVAIASRRNRKSITPVVGAIIGVGLLIAIAIGFTVSIITKKTCMSKKKHGTNNRICNNELDNEDVVPIYAKVDKSKKKRPGQIIYAELEDFKHKKEMQSVVFPPEYKDTEYADIEGLSSQVNNEPIYEKL